MVNVLRCLGFCSLAFRDGSTRPNKDGPVDRPRTRLYIFIMTHPVLGLWRVPRMSGLRIVKAILC